MPAVLDGREVDWRKVGDVEDAAGASLGEDGGDAQAEAQVARIRVAEAVHEGGVGAVEADEGKGLAGAFR